MYENFKFLISKNLLVDYIEDEGFRYRQIYFRSPLIVLRIAEESEVTSQGILATCFAFFVDPNNQNRWCTFEKAVQVLLGRRINGRGNLQELERDLRDNIGVILDLIARGHEPPLEDFSRFV